MLGGPRSSYQHFVTIVLVLYSLFFSIPLPPWVLEEISKNPELVYTDRSGRRNPEYISLGCDSMPVLRGRTPLQVYSDYMRSFRYRFRDYLGSVIIVSTTPACASILWLISGQSVDETRLNFEITMGLIVSSTLTTTQSIKMMTN